MKSTASRWVAAALVSLSFQGLASDPQSTWVYDSAKPSPSPSESSSSTTDEEQIYAVILNQLRYWNAHDIEHYMDCFWKSSDLLVVIDGEQIMGWAELLATYQRGFPNRQEMGTITLQRVKIQRLSSDFFLALSWFTIRIRDRDSYSTDTLIFRKLPEGWRVISDHASYLEP
jgi:hypothetical protein